MRPTRGVNRGYQAGILREDGTLAHFTSACAPTVYRGDRLPAELYGNVFVAEPAANLVSRIVVDDDGTTLRGKKAYDRGEFIASTDERFRPVYMSSAPDGTLYVVDIYRGIIQHRGFITEYLRDQILSRKLEQPIGRGRICRVVHDTTRRDRSSAFTQATPAAARGRAVASQRLVARHRAAAARGAQRPGGRRAVDAGWPRSAPLPRTRLQALWTLDGMDKLDAASVTQRARRLLARRAGVGAIRMAERWLRRRQRRDGDGGRRARRRPGLGGARAARGVARRTARGARRAAALRRCSSGTATIRWRSTRR